MDISLNHLQSELARIDVIIRREVRRWQLAGQDPTDDFRGLHLSAAEIDRLIQRPLGRSWGQTITLPPDEEQALTQAEAAAAQAAEEIVQQAISDGQMTRLHYLVVAFNLTLFEFNAFLICLAPTLDPTYSRFYSYLQDDVTRKQPGGDLIINLLDPTGSERLQLLPYFTNDAALFKYHLLERVTEPGQPDFAQQSLRPDQAVVTWLLGGYQPHAQLGPYANLTRPAQTDADPLLSGEVWPNLVHLADKDELPIVIFFGPDTAAQEATARLLAAQMERLLLTVDLAKVIEAGESPLTALRLALRDARLTSAIPYLTGWHACLADGALPAPILAELCNHPDLVIVAEQQGWQAEGIDRDRAFLWFEFPMPVYARRLALWQHFLPAAAPSPRPTDASPLRCASDASPLDLPTLAGQFVLTGGQIRDVIATARDRAGQRGEALTNADLFNAARIHSNPRLASLARKITPRYGWADIILPTDQVEILHEVVSTVRQRPLVLETWEVGRKLVSSRGVTILFAGEPGTGKTMAAEVIAGELGLDLYKIDLSTVVSKYIGETEKNLERIFTEAQNGNAILFFDEADSIFGKRSEVKDAHDRYANLEVSYLLQRMEAYDGVTILATNLRSNLDEAFTRRLQFVLDFPFPDEQDRLRIWQTLFPASVPSVSDLDFDMLARRFKLAGGSIRNIIVSAAYLAAADGARVTMEHLLHGTRRELQKMGRMIDKL